jgi:hypothetical protein
MALKRAVCTGLGKDKREVARVWWAEDRTLHNLLPPSFGLAEAVVTPKR